MSESLDSYIFILIDKLGVPSVKKVSMDVDVDGKGFVEKYLDTKFSGEVKSIKYNGYTYKNILADGSFKKPMAIHVDLYSFR